ncbi:MAG: heavy-metal-associated domain-containing protein [Anaerolineae bacterium]|nr:heavy-metal-associated domain-containing protein [Anaerolineae bacterium]MDW8101278.1 heavy-metal-associated domain-containing protein [Anaerolineae bacterium]
MEKVVIDLPSMYGDHHVKRVREVLLGLEGVQDVYASSMLRKVVVSYDSSKLSPSVLESKLKEAGYEPGKEPEIPRPPRHTEDQSPWFKVIKRVTQTDRRDIEMAGDFRRY